MRLARAASAELARLRPAAPAAPGTAALILLARPSPRTRARATAARHLRAHVDDQGRVRGAREPPHRLQVRV